MIPCLIVIGLAFTWLLHESDFLRLRLPVGAITPKRSMVDELFQPFTCEGRLYNPFTPTTEPIILYRKDNELISAGIARQGNGIDTTYFSPGIYEPICGWDWLLNREHPPVNYEFVIIAHGCKSTVSLNPDAHHGKIINEVSQASLRKLSRKNGNGKVKKHKGQTFNPNYGLQRA